MYLLPMPQKLEKREGIYYIRLEDNIIVDKDCGSEAFSYAILLQKDIKEELGFELAIQKGAYKNNGIFLKEETSWPEERYEIEINPNGCILTGGNKKGLLYSIQTLKQIIKQKGAVLPCLLIEDYPKIANRGFYHDVTRGRIPTLAFLKDLADKMSFYKLNQLQLYVEHTYLFENLSEVWRDDTPLTAEEILELDIYCKHLNIELIPSLSSFGHLYKLLRTKTYGHLCEMSNVSQKPFDFYERMRHHTIAVSNPEGIQLIKTLIEEYMALFSSNHFNICADETFDLGKGRSKELANNMGIKNMYVGYIKELCEFLIENGKRPMFWGDIICGFPDAVKELPKETICLNWGYAPNQTEDETRLLSQAGVVQYVCPGVQGWNQWINLIENSYYNCKNMCFYGHKYNVLGVLNTDWGDFGHINHPDFSTIGMIYGAVFSWQEKDIAFEEINSQISSLEYGDTSEAFVSMIAEMSQKSSMNWEQTIAFMKLHHQKAEEKKALYFKNQIFLDADKKNQELEDLIKKLYTIIKKLEKEKREKVSAYLMAARGMQIWNAVGKILAEQHIQKNNFRSKEPKKLAVKLEKWFYQYKQVWRSVSKESELFRIQEVVVWYADYLRDLE